MIRSQNEIENIVTMYQINPAKLLGQNFLLVHGYMRHVEQKHKIMITNDIIQFIYILYLPILIIDENKTIELESDKLHDYSSIIIEKNGCLTTNEWNPKTKTGGKLYLQIINNIIL
eukprot:379967_1